MPDDICGMGNAACVCTLPPHRSTDVHHCTANSCGGIWTDDAEGTFEIFRYPKSELLFDPPLTDADPTTPRRYLDAIASGKLDSPFARLYEALRGGA
jgi:hypothetical protein